MEAYLPLFGQCHMVSDFALQADIRHKAMPCFRVNAGRVARVWIAVGISVFYVKKQNKFITVGYGGHGLFLLVFLGVKIFHLLIVTDHEQALFFSEQG
ncbi:MAG: hypothetical protein ACD_75C00925G0001 [uncultured bacterium]|nr:MAG: hypothetical protein ACD_75C00925G0001 [uncultured bacterium]